MINPDPLLVAYVDGELDSEAELEIAPLLATDPHALQRVEMFRETAALLRDTCGDRFFAGKGPLRGKPRQRGLRQRRHGWVTATSLAAAIVAFGGGVTWGRSGTLRARRADQRSRELSSTLFPRDKPSRRSVRRSSR